MATMNHGCCREDSGLKAGFRRDSHRPGSAGHGPSGPWVEDVTETLSLMHDIFSGITTGSQSTGFQIDHPFSLIFDSGSFHPNPP